MRTISFSPPDITELEINEVCDALRSGWITTGKRVKLFEERIAKYIGTERAVCLSSQTAVAETTLRILGIGKGDEVIVPAYTYTASASVIEHVGAKIVFCDIEKDTFEIDYDKIASLITEKTKAIIPVDIGGRICDYSKIYEAVQSKKHLFKPNSDIQAAIGRVIILADSAHGFGGKRDSKVSGLLADFTTFSFHAVKNLTTGEGGAVVWKDIPGFKNDDIYREYMLYSLHGQDKDALNKNKAGAWEYDIIYTGYKYNMPDILAAVGLKQLERYESLLKRRHEIIKMYDDAFLPLGIKPLCHKDGQSVSSGHLYLARIPGITVKQRNSIIDIMAENGISCNVHYKPLPMMTAYKNLGFDIKDFPNSYAQYENEISLPLHTLLKDDDVQYIIDNFIKAIKQIV